MLYPSIDELKKRADSRYTLVMIASKRSRDLIDGYPSLVDIGNDKPVSIATEEIAEDLISYTRVKKTQEDSDQTESEMLSEGEMNNGPESEQEISGVIFNYPDSYGVDDEYTEEGQTGLLTEEDLTEEPVSDGDLEEQDDTEEPDGIIDHE